VKALAVVAAGVAGLAAPAAAPLNVRNFRYERVLRAPAAGPTLIEPDGPLYDHSRVGFSDLRIVDARGEQVPWRTVPPPVAERRAQAEILNSGRRGRQAVALVDLGPGHRVVDRIDLVVADRNFVGRAAVFGSDDRRTFTALGSSRIFALDSARGRVRSTLVTFASSDFRYLELRATGIRHIFGATVSGAAQRPALRPIKAHVSIHHSGRRTLVLVDLGYAHAPIAELSVTAATRRYDRPIEVEALDRGHGWEPVASSRIFHYYGRSSPSLAIDARAARLRIAIADGDDAPLSSLHIRVLTRRESLLIEGGHVAPLRLLYGGRLRATADYDFARVPRTALARSAAHRGALGREHLNPVFEPPPDRRSLVRRHPAMVDAALVLAALAIGAGGLLALRRD